VKRKVLVVLVAMALGGLVFKSLLFALIFGALVSFAFATGTFK
jgi:hypothetical protein